MFIRISYFFIIAVLLMTVLSGCSKNGTAIRESFQTSFSFLAISQDPVQLGVKIDDEIKFTDLVAPADNPKFFTINYFDNQKKITIYNVANEQVLFDSVFTLNTGNLSLSLYQKTSGNPFVLVVPPADAPPPSTGYSQISLVYTMPELPDEVLVVVENNKQTGVDYEETARFTLRKGEFSPYFLGKYGSRRPLFKFYTADASRVLIGEVYPGELLTAPYVIFAIRNGFYGLQTQQLY